jgi:hypothetical protein
MAKQKQGTVVNDKRKMDLYCRKAICNTRSRAGKLYLLSLQSWSHFKMLQTTNVTTGVQPERGLLDRSTARYVYKRLKASLHKPTGNLLENLFSKKCVFKNNLQLLEKKLLSLTDTTPKNGILLNKMAHLPKSPIF